ncbi:MAG: MotA/TolQ/ExbB proton channel family protein [Deltaproteobacteria bacterium]|nr:MotA/TolQ/ExbB proton channel family protein [Deltaproteobacteria bacterium]
MSLPVLDVVNQLVLAATEPVMSFDLLNMWRAMGPFAKFIAIVLAIMSVWSLAVAVERIVTRIVTYSRSGAASRKFATELATLLPAGKLREAVELSHTKEYAKGYLAKVLGMALEEYRHGLEAHKLHGGEHEIGKFDIVAAVNRAIDRGTLRTITDMRRGLGSLATIGSTAPFVGLLGTVAGIITAFQAMAATGSGGLGSVSAGISEALVTTAFGLLVAIPAVMFFNYFTNRVEEIMVDVNDSTTELVDFIIKEGR